MRSDRKVKQFQEFVNVRLIKKTKSRHESISKNNLPLMTHTKPRNFRAATKLATAQQNCDLFSSLYIACHSRDGDVDECFSKKTSQVLQPYLIMVSCTKLKSLIFSIFLKASFHHQIQFFFLQLAEVNGQSLTNFSSVLSVGVSRQCQTSFWSHYTNIELRCMSLCVCEGSSGNM